MSALHSFLLPIELEIPRGWRSALLNGKQLILTPPADLMDSIDPDALDEIADDIGSDDKHRLRAHFLRALAKKQREAVARVECRQS
jgi:hypothetical protein